MYAIRSYYGLIDRPLRPLFPEGYYFETQVIASVLSSDKTGSSDVIGITAASAALAVSNIPFLGPIAGVKIGRVNGQFVVNPDLETLKDSELDLVVAGTRITSYNVCYTKLLRP